MKIEMERIVNLPVEETWKIIADFSNVQHIHPMVKTVDQLSENDRGVGATRRCNFYDGGCAKETITYWDEAKRTYAVELKEASLPLNSAVATLHVTAYGADKSKVAIEMDMDPKYGIFGKFMGHLFMKPKLGGVMGNVISGVEYYKETNKDVPRNWSAPKKAVSA